MPRLPTAYTYLYNTHEQHSFRIVLCLIGTIFKKYNQDKSNAIDKITKSCYTLLAKQAKPMRNEFSLALLFPYTAVH